MVAKPGGDGVGIGSGIELLVKAKVNRQLPHHIFLEILVTHSLGAVGDQRGGIDHHVLDVYLDPFAGKGVPPPGVDRLALVVHHIVIFKKSLTNAEVVLFHLLLGILDRLREHSVHQRLVIRHPKPVHDARDPLGPEQAHELVLKGDVERRRTGVALTAGTAAQLPVHTA